MANTTKQTVNMRNFRRSVVYDANHVVDGKPIVSIHSKIKTKTFEFRVDSMIDADNTYKMLIDMMDNFSHSVSQASTSLARLEKLADYCDGLAARCNAEIRQRKKK